MSWSWNFCSMCSLVQPRNRWSAAHFKWNLFFPVGVCSFLSRSFPSVEMEYVSLMLANHRSYLTFNFSLPSSPSPLIGYQVPLRRQVLGYPHFYNLCSTPVAQAKSPLSQESGGSSRKLFCFSLLLLEILFSFAFAIVVTEVKSMQCNSWFTVFDLLPFNALMMTPCIRTFKTFSLLERNPLFIELSPHLFLPLGNWQALVCASSLWLYKSWKFHKIELLHHMALWALFLTVSLFLFIL